ncbi:hypothetical protein [Pedobacter sp.]|uniref:hypothetical protein n=1 Tax=Pedobacter sp. TaxID=1411316 RepID=UPI0031E11745
MLQELSPLVFGIITIAISVVALVYSIRSYKQSHKINNENILYQEKINAYKDIMYSLSDLLNTIQLYLQLTEEKIKQKALKEEDIEEISEFTDEIDDKVNEFDNVVKANSSILPNKILNKLDYLVFELFDVKPLIDLEKYEIPIYEKSLDTFYEQAGILVDAFRKDLNTKALNQTLFKRIKRK